VNDSQQVTKGIMSFMELIREPLTFLGFLLTALFSSWKLTLIILTVAPIVFYIIATVGKLIKRYTNRSLEQFGLIGIILNESFTGMKIIKAFTIEYLIKLRFLENNKKLYNAMVKIYKIENLSTPFVEFLGSIIAAIVIYIGGVWVINSEITQGQFMTVLIALGLAQQPLKAINSSNISLQTAISGIDRIKEILNLKIEKIHIGEKLKEFNNSIKLKNVNFNYIDSESNVLKNINLEIKKGEVIALVGTSGSGKTTLANLIPRFFEPSSGEILIDGVNINKYSLKSLRKKIALVSQDTFLFKDSIKTNMLAGNNKANKEDIKNALNLAYAYDFVETFEDKEETIIGERGTRLSGGEKQRLAIARAIIKNAPILILDEATSSLDTESEIKVQKALDRLMENKTTLVIAHRLSTIKNANKIIVMENGKIVQEGKHSDLINIKGPYKDFYEKQWR
jgi:subfamily B ATP-binding cassette protein MsbA